uniref:Uncharacterized protein n=1 Tax=Phaeomonas parva TaxID=124430 RepID=A0A7S1UHV8_9STRA|mmetsp:Transcript_6109/g.17053  ORF Transcript_6109/g.17053 Transcript_6109/m.17053 type:complete len:123 (+) Transcript_6109:181-549(+)
MAATTMRLSTRLLAYVLLALYFADEALGKKRNRNRMSKVKSVEERWGAVRWVIALCLFGVVGPLLLSFGYSLYKDPATPQLVAAITSNVKSRVVGYLGATDEESNPNARGASSPKPETRKNR